MVQKTQKKKQVEETAVQLAEGTVFAEPRYKIGDPYTVGGLWYYPERNLTYDETGIGSWYGDEFAGRLTANGEILENVFAGFLVDGAVSRMACIIDMQHKNSDKLRLRASAVAKDEGSTSCSQFFKTCFLYGFLSLQVPQARRFAQAIGTLDQFDQRATLDARQALLGEPNINVTVM